MAVTSLDLIWLTMSRALVTAVVAVSTLAAPRPRASETAPMALSSDFMVVEIDQ